MKEEKVIFSSDGLNIEGLSGLQQGNKSVVITHPHPLYGGNMDNPIVQTLADVYYDKGYSTLRFNFRGAGNSEGSHDKGEGEKEDVRSALRYLHSLGKKDFDLAGYSFGAWINAGIIDDSSSLVSRLVMISPPVSSSLKSIDFSFLRFNKKIKILITGEKDDIASPEKIKDLITTWNPGACLEVIKNADHFYSGKTDALKAVLSRLID